MRRTLCALLLLCAAAPAGAQPETPCGPEAPCVTPHGSYHLMPPADWDGTGQRPVLLFLHGHRASGRMIYTTGGLRTEFAERGWWVVAPNGTPIPETDQFAWPGTTPGPGARDDLAFVAEVLADLGARSPLGPVFVSGFSAGASMAWMLACHAPGRFAGFAPVAGTLRQPQPAPCQPDPVRLLQIHGFADAQVPFEGRALGNWHQGDLYANLAGLRDRNLCRSSPDSIRVGETYRCRTWSESCATGAVTLCEHDGGHGLPFGWAALARAFLDPRDD